MTIHAVRKKTDDPDSIKPPTFERWLKFQKKRDDPVGDLARDFSACTRTCHKNAKTVKESMYSHDPIPDADKAYNRALKEYKNDMKGFDFLNKNPKNPTT